MWIVMKAFSWKRLELEGLPSREFIAHADLGDRFIPVFDDYEKAKEVADREGVRVCEVEAVSP